MPISRDQFSQRLTQLKGEAERLKEQFHAVNGAIADCQFWLDQEPADSTTPVTAPPPSIPQD